MKKSPIIAAAIAATIAGSAFAADTTIYGNMRLELLNQTELDMDSSKLVIGFKAAEDMGNGMTGFMRLELENDDPNTKNSSRKITTDVLDANGNPTGETVVVNVPHNDWDNDLAYVGVKGGFGSVSLGVQNDAAGFACSGTDLFTKNGGNACNNGAVNGHLNNALVYVGTAGDLTFVLAATLDGSQDAPAGNRGDNTIVAAKYAAGDFSVGAQITSYDDEVMVDATQMVIGGTYKIGDIQLGFTFSDNDADDDSTAMALGLKMPLAGGTFKAAIDTGDALEIDADNDGTAINLEYNKSLSKSVYWGASFTTVDDEVNWDDDQIVGWLGMKF